MIAAIVCFVEIGDVVKADVPFGVLFRNLRALPDHFHGGCCDGLDDNLAGPQLLAQGLPTPTVRRIWRPIRSQLARSCANAKKAHAPITDIYKRSSPGTSGGSITIAVARSRSGQTFCATRTI